MDTQEEELQKLRKAQEILEDSVSKEKIHSYT